MANNSQKLRLLKNILIMKKEDNIPKIVTQLLKQSLKMRKLSNK